MRQRGPASRGTLFTCPTESAWKFQEDHREDSSLEQHALFSSPFLSCSSFPPAVGEAVTGSWKTKASVLIGQNHRKTSVERWGCWEDRERTQMGLGRWTPHGRGWRGGQSQGDNETWAGWWAVGMIIDQTSRHSWTPKTGVTLALGSSWG